MPRRTSRIVLAAVVAATLVVGCGGTQRTDEPDREEAPVEEANPEAYVQFVQAEMLARGGLYLDAADVVRGAIDEDPEVPLLHLQLGRYLTFGGMPEDALVAFDAAERAGASIDELVPARADALVSLDRAPEALAVFADANSVDRAERFFLSWLSTASEAEDDAAAVAAAEAYVDAHAMSNTAWRQLALAYLGVERWDDALNAYEQAFMLPGGIADDAESYVRLLAERFSNEQALDATDVCIERFREHIDCYVLRVMLTDVVVSNGEGDLAEATLESVARVVRMTAGSVRLFQRTGAALVETGRPALGVAFAREGAEQRPFNVGLLEAAGWVAYTADDIDTAVALMQQALDIDRTNVTALNFIGYMWAERGESLEQAELYVREALYIRPNDPNIMDSLAWVYFQMERYEEALELQEAAIAIDDTSAVLLDHLGDIYRALGRIGEAVEAWERALEAAGPRDQELIESIPAKIDEARSGS